MNKAELVAQIAAGADLTKVEAETVLDTFTSAVASTLAKGDSVKLIGFGTFSISERGARKGRNPQTGKEIDIPAKKITKFKAGSKLSEVVA